MSTLGNQKRIGATFKCFLRKKKSKKLICTFGKIALRAPRELELSPDRVQQRDDHSYDNSVHIICTVDPGACRRNTGHSYLYGRDDISLRGLQVLLLKSANLLRKNRSEFTAEEIGETS